ncbi:MAG: 3-isopropylmalate dehydratase small subunit [Steroidobacter sp.]
MEPIRKISSRTVVLPYSDIDTDQIIPARFLTTTSKTGLGQHAFSNWRYNTDGSLKADFILNQPAAQGCQILVAGNNFGCGSSREHAPWALLDCGFKAVISTEIADIFRNNSLKNGLLPLVIDKDTHAWLMNNPGAAVEINLETNSLSLPNGKTVSFSIEGFARYCLLNGVDELGFLLNQIDTIKQYEQAHA